MPPEIDGDDPVPELGEGGGDAVPQPEVGGETVDEDERPAGPSVVDGVQRHPG